MLSPEFLEKVPEDTIYKMRPSVCQTWKDILMEHLSGVHSIHSCNIPDFSGIFKSQKLRISKFLWQC